MVNLLIRYFNRKADLSTRFLRLNFVAAVTLYLLFGIVDMYAMPQSYHKAWCIRSNFAIILSVFALLSFKPRLKKSTHRVLIISSVLVASLGLFLMTLIATQYEYAYTHYVYGQCLIILWAVAAYKLNTRDISLVSILIVSVHLIIAIGVQKLHLYHQGSSELAAFASGLFVLICTCLISIFGAWRYDQYISRLNRKREQLFNEKQKLRRAIFKAEESERLKSAFLANMSHEIRTPMHAVLGFSQLLRRPDVSKEKQNEFINLIETKGNQLLGLVDNILELSRIDAQMVQLEMKYFQVQELFDSLQNQMLESILIRNNKANLNIRFDCNGGQPVLYADYNRISLMLFHLLDNAVKFTQHGSVLCTYQSNGEVHIFRVADTGIGISKEQVSVIFNRFRQSYDNESRPYSGTGLGLSIVQGLVKILNGEIHVDSAPQKGSVFTVVLPHQIPHREKADSQNKVTAHE